MSTVKKDGTRDDKGVASVKLQGDWRIYFAFVE
jgi:hypothetical protein